MIFYSLPFLVLFLASTVFFHLAKTQKQQHGVILLTNILFYGFWDVRFLALLLGMIGICYASGLGYQKNKHMVWIAIPVTTGIAMLCILKYYNFFLESFCRMLGITNGFTLQIILPLGISFYTFQALSYIFDVKNEKIPVERNFVKLAAYISFFPQVTSGPIVKAHDFLPQMQILHRIRKENCYKGLQLFLLGLTKKVVFADRIGVAVNAVFQTPLAYDGISIFFAVIGYALQIYCDFSGYSDMAVGIAAIWDFDLGKNFNMPYLAKNPSDFWKRWHISLSSWFQEYVYIPLGGSRCEKWKMYRNIVITMLLSGLWHGANWTFVIWGLLHGIGSVINKMYRSICRSRNIRSTERLDWVHILLNNVFVVSLWIVFRADSIRDVPLFFTGLFRQDGIRYISVFTVIYTALIVAGNMIAYFKNEKNMIEINLNLDLFRNKLVICVWIFLIIMFAYIGDSAFIYAQF